ncbi:MAG: roadblock/LC7 domain-containing protein, partial [Myxococcota bacterium]
MSRAEKLNRAIRSLSTTTADIEAAAVVDNDGLMMASSLPQDIDEEAVAAMSAALLGISERISDELGRGDFEMNLVRGVNGLTLMMRCGPEAVLVVLTTPKAK